MVDLIKCLREHQGENDPPWMTCIMDKAADEIERLQQITEHSLGTKDVADMIRDCCRAVGEQTK